MVEYNSTDKEELIKIYNNLHPPLKNQIVSIAKIIEDTQNLIINEYKNELHKAKTL